MSERLSLSRDQLPVSSIPGYLLEYGLFWWTVDSANLVRILVRLRELVFLGKHVSDEKMSSYEEPRK